MDPACWLWKKRIQAFQTKCLKKLHISYLEHKTTTGWLGAEQGQLSCGSTRNSSDDCQRDRNLHDSGTSHTKTASPKPSFRAPWRACNTVVSRENAEWTMSKSGHPCPCRNYSQWPPAEKTGRGSLLNSPSCPPEDPIGQGTELNWTIHCSLGIIPGSGWSLQKKILTYAGFRRRINFFFILFSVVVTFISVSTIACIWYFTVIIMCKSWSLCICLRLLSAVFCISGFDARARPHTHTHTHTHTDTSMEPDMSKMLPQNSWLIFQRAAGKLEAFKALSVDWKPLLKLPPPPRRSSTLVFTKHHEMFFS